MKKVIIALSTIVFFGFQLIGQNSEAVNLPSDLYLNPETSDFITIQQNVEAYYEGKDKGRGTGYKQWKRWEQWNSTRLSKEGNIVNQAPIRYQTYRAAKKRQGPNLNRNIEGDWKPWSATNFVNAGSWSPGIGRVNVIAYHPTDPNMIYCGTPAGGLFRTTDHGETWVALTDNLASIGVSGIAIHPTNPNNIYILTGDGDGGNTRSIGVYQTNDGGQNWDATGLAWNQSDNVRGYKLVMEPGSPDHLIVVTNLGIHRSTNSGDDWTLVQQVVNNSSFGANRFTDIEFKPGAPMEVYASSEGDFWKSTDAGENWTVAYNVPNGARRTQIAVTPANPEAVYLLNGPDDSVAGQPGFRGVYRSTNSGNSFSLRANTPNILGGQINGGGTGDQSWYDLAIMASPTDENTILTGGVNIYRSIDAGQTLTLEGHWEVDEVAQNPNFNLAYIHADHHHISYNPINNRIYAGTDGGIFWSDDNGESWNDITAGMNISQIYHFDGRDADPSLMLAGMQDNGTSIMKRDTMLAVLGADGVDCLMHPTDPNTMYAMWQNGTLVRTTTGPIPGGGFLVPMGTVTGVLLFQLACQMDLLPLGGIWTEITQTPFMSVGQVKTSIAASMEAQIGLFLV